MIEIETDVLLRYKGKEDDFHDVFYKYFGDLILDDKKMMKSVLETMKKRFLISKHINEFDDLGKIKVNMELV